VLGIKSTTPSTAQVPKDRAGMFCGAAFFILLIVVIVGLSPFSAQKAVTATGDGNIIRQLGYILIFGFVLLAARVNVRPQLFLTVPFSLALTLLWCWISLKWSIEPSIAIRRLLLTSMIVWTVFIAVEKAGYERTIAILHLALALVLAVNFIAIVISPTAVHRVADVVDPGLIGDWRGVLPQKNFAGAVCAFQIILLVFAGQRLQWLYRAALILGAALFLYKTGSKTSLALLVIVLALGFLYTRYNVKFRALLAPLFIVLVGLAVLIGQYYWSDVFANFDQNALTGRGKIWTVLATYIQDHWLLGAGYGSFWNVGPYSPVYFYTHSWVKLLGNGHNGYLDVFAQLGLPGLVLAVFAMVLIPLGKLLASTSIARERGALLIALLVFCAGHNVTESSMLDRDMIVQVFFLTTLALIGLATRPPRVDPSAQDPYWAWIRPKPRAVATPPTDLQEHTGASS